MRSYGGRLRWLISGLALFWLCSGSAYAAATVGIVTSNANPVAGGAAFSYTVTITNNAVAASNVRASLPMPSGARFQNLAIAGTGGGSFECTQPAAGRNGLVDCVAPQMPASTVATVTVVASFQPDMAGGVRTATARVISQGAPVSTAQVGQTVVNNASFTQSITDAEGGTLSTRRLRVNVSSSSSVILPAVSTILPDSAYLAWIEATGDLVDTCSFEMVSREVLCQPRSLSSGVHVATIVYGRATNLFRDGFE